MLKFQNKFGGYIFLYIFGEHKTIEIMTTDYTVENKTSKSNNVPVIDGPILEDIMKGATIVHESFDGWDWLIVVRRNKSETEKTGWEFAQYETMFNIGNMRMSLMRTMNWSLSRIKKEADKERWDNFGFKTRCAQNAII